MDTGIFIRAQVNGKWDAYDIGDKALSDKQVLDWMRSREHCAEQVAMLFLDRNQEICMEE